MGRALDTVLVPVGGGGLIGGIAASAAEPAASVGIAALLTGAYKPAPGEHVAVVISGANMAPSQLESQLG